MGGQMSQVLPGLYVGNFRDATDEQQLVQNKITHILSIHDHAKPVLEHLKYLCIKASDTPNQDLSQYFRDCTKFIHEARLQGGCVLVHCLAGVSRSVTVTVAYIMTITSHNWQDTLAAVRKARSVANPNFGFLEQLQKFETDRLAEERGWLKATFPNTDWTEDERTITELCAKYREDQEKEKEKYRGIAFGATAERETGCVSSRHSLNPKEDFLPSSNRESDVKSGWTVQEETEQNEMDET